MSLENNLQNFVIVNDKNKIAYHDNTYYHVMMVKNGEYNSGKTAFYKFNSKPHLLYGIEPILSIRSEGTIYRQYTFRNETRDDINDDKLGLHNIPINIPWPKTGYEDELTDRQAKHWGNERSVNGVGVFCKPHISDMQIIQTTDYLHIFALCDIINAYAPISIGHRTVDDWYGLYTRVVIYQQHQINNTGNNQYLTITPNKKTCFPMHYANTRFGTLKYGSFLKTMLHINSINYHQWAWLYHRSNNVTDFDCGLIDDTHIYCIIGKDNKKLELYCAAINFSTDLDWKYRIAYKSGSVYWMKKFSEYRTKDVPFNIYSHYVDSTYFYISYSYYNAINGNIKYEKLKSNSFKWKYGWNPLRVFETGAGIITYYATTNINTHMNFIFDTGVGQTLKCFKGKTQICNTMPGLSKVTYDDIGWKYKLPRLTTKDIHPRPGFFRFSNNGKVVCFSSGKLQFYHNSVMPLATSLLKYYSATYASYIYLFYANIGKEYKYIAQILYKNDKKHESYFGKCDFRSQVRDGNYYLNWKTT